MSQSKLSPQFAKLYQKYLELQKAAQSEQLDAQTFQSELSNLKLRDKNGDDWRVSKDGHWYYHNGIEWVRRDPPLLEAAPEQELGAPKLPTPAETPSSVESQTPEEPQTFEEPQTQVLEQTPAEPPKKKKVKWPCIVVPIVIIVGCVCLVILLLTSTSMLSLFASGSGYDYAEEKTNISESSLDAPSAVELSEDQQLVYDDFGWPDTFTISEIDDILGNHTRQETWVYFLGKTSYTFSDGDFVTSGEAQPLPEGFIPAPYKPNQFKLGASPEQVKELMGTFPLTSIEESEDIQVGGQFFVGQQLILGFLDDRLFFVDTLAFIPEGSD